MFTIVLTGKNKTTASQLKRLLGSHKQMVQDLIEYMQVKDGSLVIGFCLAPKASVGEANLDTYPSDGSVPQELLDAVLNPQNPNDLRGRASSSYTNGRRESEAIDEDYISSDEEGSGDSDSENDPGEDGRAYIIDAYAVVDSAEDTVTSSLQLVARTHMVRDFIDYMKDIDGSLVNGFGIARKSSVGEANVDTYASDESVLQEFLTRH
eukprot:jgi/Undpi1/7830/HiC_scaffold_23.g10303.m1